MASVEPPLLFQSSSQQPSSPSFASPPQSPGHLIHAQTPVSPPPPSADIDMSSSVTTLAPAGQRHDREGANMQDEGDFANAPPGESPASDTNLMPPSNAVAVQVAAVDDDAMDTTPDAGVGVALSHALQESQDGPVIAPASPSAGAHPLEGQSGNDQTGQIAMNDEVSGSNRSPGHYSREQTPADISEPVELPLSVDATSQPPPPPPPVEPIRTESESSDDDDGMQPWHPIHEDTSSPDETELKEIDESTEHSGLDHEYWESKAFLPLDQPEFKAGVSGRIHWEIEAYNGTREKPNRDVVMKSDIVTIGGHQWQVKFYPKGNDSDYLSVYLDCLSVMNKDKGSEQDSKPSNDVTTTEDATHAVAIKSPDLEVGISTSEASREPQHAPLPLLGDLSIPQRKSVAAQVSVVLYNPTEPRVNHSRTALHRFCSGSPDWGWTRFHGPYYDIAHRTRGQRQALLRDDKLSFTAYIRIVEDETGCLWEHHSRENPWDSFAMTGLQSLILGENASAPGGNMISAVASWLLFRPFRQLLYNTEIVDPGSDSFSKPRPLLGALQKVLYMMRTQVKPGAGPVALDDVLDALEWYHIFDRLDKLDVIEIWEVLRTKLEEELKDTPHHDTLHTLFGPRRDCSSSSAAYRVSVLDVETLQHAVEKAAGFGIDSQEAPQLLTIELERQGFDVKSRSYIKLLNKVALDETLMVGESSYTLFGLVVHKQTLQSYVYQPVLRPEGPGSRWYSYSDSKEENQVKCLTKKQALDEHEGKIGEGQIVGNDPVAYIAMYVRDDISQVAFAFDCDSEKWNVPEWIPLEVDKLDDSSTSLSIPVIQNDDTTNESTSETKTVEKAMEKAEVMIDCQVVKSNLFDGHEGPGTFDAFDTRWTVEDSEHCRSIQLSSKTTLQNVIGKLASAFPEVKDHRQLHFWFIDPVHGSYGRPQLLRNGRMPYSRSGYGQIPEKKEWILEDYAAICRKIWVHITKFEQLPELPKVAEEQEPASAAIEVLPSDEMLVESSSVESEANTIIPPPEAIQRTEDTPMSESEEQAGGAVVARSTESASEEGPVIAESADTAMSEEVAADAAAPIVLGIPIPIPAGLADTEMGGTQEAVLIPPPPPIHIPIETLQPPPPRARTPEPPPSDIYFFLKLWNPENQKLESRGSHFVSTADRVDETVVKLLGLPVEDKKKIEMWEEEELTTTRPIKHRRTFSQLDLVDATVIIAALPLTEDQRSELASRAACIDAQSFLAYRAAARNFPHKMNGHFTYNYFSGQNYKGEIKNGHYHGQGSRIYHSGATYTGSFRLGLHHGHGLYTFQNGDTYDGEWVDNQQHGTGTFVEAATGNTYVGGWKNDKKFGEGVTHWKNAQEAERMCRICWDEAADAAFYDCGHVVACLTCAREVQTCPVCRKRVLSAMKLYYVA